ncbi:Sphingomyelinase C precursor [Mycobacteroides abscessus subsp. bolletii]|uniref:endonuclease/exonuclease/phosphatase family protein n=6 Tax=Mycobacteroides abscessus TaxID=36809 RepID=UPI0009D0F9BC|nr:endonuclease/exonuclease/phosphatase family protein [Mycobacteroides abscessus]SKF98323.1 Sphingomyelinase C precursor [Mycobacteroides abscessus subsp. bolletii]SKH77629.1 Sphingomyelinase C precursor [Mycobacteroides abscessus subsp. bolletii]
MSIKAVVNMRGAVVGAALVPALILVAQPPLARAGDEAQEIGPAAMQQPAARNRPEGAAVTGGGYNLYQYPDFLNPVFDILAPSRYIAPDPSIDLSPDGRVTKTIDYINKSGVGFWALQEDNGTNGKKIKEGVRREYPYQSDRLGESCANVSGACSSMFWTVNGGVSTVSKVPITETYYHVYTKYAPLSPDALSNKGVVLTKMIVDGKPLWVANTHMQADGTLDDEISDPNGVRRQQAEELGKFVANHVPKGEPIVFIGDFNATYYAGRKASMLDDKGRSQLERLEDKLGLKVANVNDQPLSYDPDANPLAKNFGDPPETLDLAAHSPDVALKNVKIVPLPPEEIVSDHFPQTMDISLLTDADITKLAGEAKPFKYYPADVKPGETAHWDITPNIWERNAYWLTQTASFSARFLPKLIMEIVPGFAVSKVQAVAQLVNDVTKFAADRVRDVAQLVSRVSTFAGDRVRDVAQLMQHVSKFATGVVVHLAEFVRDVMKSAYRAIVGGPPSTEKDKSVAEIKKELNDAGKADPKDTGESTSRTAKDLHVKNADNKKTHDETDGDHKDSSAAAHQKETQSTTDGSASVHADAEHRQADDKHLQQDTKAAQGVTGAATSSTGHTQDKETDLAAGHLATTTHENTQVKTPAASTTADAASSAAGTTAPDTSAGTEHPSKPTTKKAEQPHKTTNTTTTQDKTSTTNPKTNTTSPKTEKPDTQKPGADHGRSGLTTTENSSAAGATSSSTGRSSAKQPSTADHATNASSASAPNHDTKTSTTKDHDNTRGKND